MPADVVDVQKHLDDSFYQWKQNGCPTEPSSAAKLHPIPTLARIISNWTNTFYGGRSLRSCTFDNIQLTNATLVEELTCSYDDLDLALVIRLTDGLKFLEKLRYSPPPPPSPPVPPVASNSHAPPMPVDKAQEPPATSQGLNGCFITSSDCGDHGTLQALSPSGCTCVCETGWQNAGQPSSSKYYCSGAFGSVWQECRAAGRVSGVHTECAAEYTGLSASPPPPPLNPDGLWRNITQNPPPPPKVYVSESWWEQMGPGGWLGLTCGLIVFGKRGPGTT